jgi:hypothetical protein
LELSWKAVIDVTITINEFFKLKEFIKITRKQKRERLEEFAQSAMKKSSGIATCTQEANDLILKAEKNANILFRKKIFVRLQQITG